MKSQVIRCECSTTARLKTILQCLYVCVTRGAKFKIHKSKIPLAGSMFFQIEPCFRSPEIFFFFFPKLCGTVYQSV